MWFGLATKNISYLQSAKTFIIYQACLALSTCTALPPKVKADTLLDQQIPDMSATDLHPHLRWWQHVDDGTTS